MQPMNTLPVPLPPNNSGGSYSTMFGSGSFTDGAANSLRSQGYNLKKSSNGSNVDKTTLINRFKQNRSSSNQTAYRNDIELLKSLNYVTTKNPSRNTLEKSYTDFLTDFYSSDVNDLSDYVSQRLSTTDATFTGSRTTTSRQVSTADEAAKIITTAYKDYLNIILPPGAKEVTSFVKALGSLEKNLAARTTTTRDASGNATTTTVGGVATKEDKETLALDFISKALSKQEGIVNAGPTLSAGLTAIRKFANDYGVVIPDADVRGYAVQYLRDGKLDFITEKLKNISKARYPSLAPFIDQGVNPREIASQYIVRKAQLLEIPIESINLFDNDVTRAISGQVLETIGDFDNRMRQSPLWQFTKNAKEKGADFINNILSRFGMV
jgi:hypothetical protein